MNEEQEKQLVAFLERRDITAGVERDVDEHLVQEVCSEVAEWYTKAEVGDSHTVLKNDGTRKLKYNYVFQNELRSRFEGILTSMDEDRNLVVTKVTPEEGEKVKAKPRTDSSELYCSLTGFRRLFLLLIEQQKPLLGHNMLMDLLLIYDKFHKPLPAHYKDFKTEIHRIFPLIIDTKQISTYMIRKKIDLKFNSTLGGLYKVLSSPAGQQFVIYSPIIEHGEGFESYSNETFLPHEAGYDAYMCGYCFLRLCHMMTFMNIPSTGVVPCTFTRYLNVMKEFHNKVNVIRASVNSVNLAGSENESQRPLVFVQSKTSSFQLSAFKLAREFSKFGTVDIKLYSRHKALVATGNIFCARDLVRNYRNDNRMSVQHYSRWRHSPFVRPALLTGIVVSGGLCLWALWYSRKNNT